MEQNDREGKQYSGTKGLSLAIVIGVAIGTVIGKLTGNMNTGLMVGIVLGVAGWTLLFNRRGAKEAGQADAAEADKEKDGEKPE